MTVVAEPYKEEKISEMNLIALRKHHPAFRMGNADMVTKHLEFLAAPTGVVAYRLKDHAYGDIWADIIVLLNANRKAMQVEVPAGDYTVVCYDGCIDEQGMQQVSGPTISVGAQSALIMYK